MRKLLAYPLTVIHLLVFGLSLLIFHPIQMICRNLFGYKVHKKSVDLLQWCLVHSLYFLASRVSFQNDHDIPTDRPLILVSNHQSMHDIPALMWHMRKHHVKFVSKQELGKGIPSVSYNLRHGGSVLIDRKNPRQALPALMEFGEFIKKNNYAAVIFPEGTRSKDGNPKPFQTRGMEILFKKVPNGLAVPVTINNSWKLYRYGKFPMGIGNHITFKVHKPLEIANFNDKKELMALIENTVIEAIKP